jgi:KTSC domain
MRRKPVASPAVISHGYDLRSRTLEIHYSNGSVYQYYPVPPEIYQELSEDLAVGTYVNYYIKPYFKCREVRRRSA